MEGFAEPLLGCSKTPGLFCCILTFAFLGAPCCVQANIVARLKKKNWVKYCIPACLCLCVGAAYNRNQIRKKYSMPKQPFHDCLLHMVCLVCAVNQEFLEVHKKEGSMSLARFLQSGSNNSSFSPPAPEVDQRLL